ncbi:hypothetical protein FBY10_102583 [Pseudomonas sp. SJZ103]|nr:hypothetical protein FBY10_102583 [Pseudomonas sp. SJZ103]TWC83302.1 hypothetical protein FBY08_10924 [Pseudomonas sp. SJZ094]
MNALHVISSLADDHYPFYERYNNISDIIIAA